MSDSPVSERLLVERVRVGEEDAWDELISRFEGRLWAFVESRIGDRAAAEDVVQETFIGFLTSLPNFDSRRSLESYLFSIASHKLTDHLRREGRRPTLPLIQATSDDSSRWEPAGPARSAGSILRSGERKDYEDRALAEALRDQVAAWRQRGDWLKIQCVELLFVRGLPNKETAVKLGISEQTVANHKFEFLAKLRTAVRKGGLPQDIFPELYESSEDRSD